MNENRLHLNESLHHNVHCERKQFFSFFSKDVIARIVPLSLLVCIGLFLSGSAFGQQLAANYGFAASAGTYTPLTGGTSVGPFTDIISPTVNADDGAVNGIPIGFTFNFCGAPYTTIGVDINGFITFSTFTTYSPYWENDFPSEGVNPQIAGFWDDMYDAGTTNVSYTTSGNPGSQIFTLEFANLANTGPGTASTSFEIKLYEGTNIIQMCYGSTVLGDWSPSGTIGIANSFTDWQNITNTSDFTTPAVSSTVANDNISIPVPNGTIFTWTPPPPCALPAAQPTALTLTPGAGAINGSFTAATPAADDYLVILTTSATPPANPVNGTIYTVGSNALGGTVVSTGASTTFTATGLTSATPYWLWVYSYSNTLCTGPTYLTATPLNGTTNTLACSISGTFVVGPTGDYTTIASAIAALTLNGQNGPVILTLQSTYAGETYPVTIGSIPCSSPTNNLIIRPQGQTALTITGSSATEMFDLNGAQNVTIDGRIGSVGTTSALTISNTSTSGGVIRFINDASNNVIKYCTLQSVYNTGNTTNNNGTIFFSTALSAGNDNNHIDNCSLLDGATTPQVGIMSLGTQGMENDHDTVSNCNIANYFSAVGATDGILMSTGTSDWAVLNNRFYQTATRTFTSGNTQRAIYMNNTSTGNNFTITGNTIGYASSAGTGTYAMAGSSTVFEAIYFNGATATPSSIQGNTITNISLVSSSTSNTAGGFLCGIDIPSGSVNVGTTAPNIIGAATGTGAIFATGSGNGGSIVGISSSAASPAIVNIENNIIGAMTDSSITANKATSVQGIQASSSGKVTISGNSIGSTTTAKSMNAATISTSSTAQLMYGINASTSNPDTILNNTITNLNNAQTTTAGLTSGILYTGSTNGAGFISGNTINNINGASANVNVTGQTGVSGIAYTGSSSANITQNVINAISNVNAGAIQSNVSGIGISNSANGIVQRNKIYDLRNASTGTTATSPPTAIGVLCGAPGTGGITITNNFISLGTAQATNTEFVGIMGTGTSANVDRIYYNSIDIEGAAAAGTLPTVGILRGNNTTTAATAAIDIKDNISVNNRGGAGKNYAIANDLNATTSSATGWGANGSNYDILNTTNAATVGYWSGDQTFATWQSTGSVDQNSYSASPVVFTNVATDDLHINMGTTPNSIESHGTVIALVTTDYDNDVRPGPVGSINGGATAPDIGADEFDGVPTDNIPPAITYTPLLNTCGFGDITFSATVADPSGVPLTGSGTEPKVYYKEGVNGTWFSHSGALASGTQTNGVWNFAIVASDMGGVAVGDTIYYYIIAQDDLGNTGSNPALGLVASNVNTVTTAPTTPNYYLIGATLSGTYTVGATGNYTTLTAAVNAYTSACLSGPVTFQLTDATYPNETFPMVIGDNLQASAINTLTIEPAPGVAASITGTASAGALIKLLNAQYITIDGLNTGGSSLTLTSTNTNNTEADIWLASTTTTGPGCNFINLNNMNLVGGGSSASSNWNIIASADGANVNTNAGMDNDNVTIHGNIMTQSGYGVYANGTTAVSAGGLDNWSIDNNTFGPDVYNTTTNLGFNAMFLQGMVNASVTNDTMQNIGLTSSSSQCVGVYLASSITGIVIDHNIIKNITSDNTGSTTSSTCAIEVGNNVLNTTISKNVITGISDIETGGFGCRGIIVNTGSNTANTTIANNMISDISCYTDPSALFWPIGIDIEGASGGVNVYFNSISLFGGHSGLTSGTGSACFYVNTTGTGIDVRDNIFSNTYNDTSSTSYKGWAIYSANANSVFSNVDYNDYYAATPDVLANIGGTAETTLAAIQSGFGGNTHSLNIAPLFVTPTDLHLQVVSSNVPLIAGIPLAGITTDIDGTARSLTTPVVGAHEVVITGCYYVTAGTALASKPSLCVSGLDTLTLSGATQASGLIYQWQSSTDSVNWNVINGATGSSYDAPIITATTYFRNVLTCTNSNISDSATVKVQVNPLPVISVTPNGGGYCSGAGSVTMTASGAVTYMWAPAAGLSSTNTASVTANPVATVIYTVTGTDADGCRSPYRYGDSYKHTATCSYHT